MKSKFIELMNEKIKIYRISVFAYCIMDNHYHIILENSSGRLSDCMRDLGSKYGFFYRGENGGRGYVFQDRFDSTLIQNEEYLLTAIPYIMRNPVKANLVDRFDKYFWSSGSLYFSGKESFIDSEFVEDLFSSKDNFYKSMQSEQEPDYKILQTKFGQLFGDDSFIKEAEKKYDRRKSESVRNKKRSDDQYFEPIEKIIYEFEKKHEIKLDKIDTCSINGKRLRGEFLVLLKELSGLKYIEIKEFDLFSDMSFSSLGSLYFHTKKRNK